LLVVTHLTTNSPVSCSNRAEQMGSLVVACFNTTKTAKSSVYGITQLLTKFCRKEKDLLALHSFGLGRSSRNSVAQAAKRPTNSSDTTCSCFLSTEQEAYDHQHDRRRDRPIQTAARLNVFSACRRTEFASLSPQHSSIQYTQFAQISISALCMMSTAPFVVMSVCRCHVLLVA
jgi:hypothetical protein